MVNINGLTMDDMKSFLDLMKKANSCQLFAMQKYCEHEIESRNQSALIQMNTLEE
jgi:hypothetical protein